MTSKKKDNIINFPSKLSQVEKEIEAIIFSAAEPLNIETIQNKLSKRTDVEKILIKLQKEYNERMFIQANKDKIKEQEQVINIGEVDSVEYTPNYMDDEELFLKAVVDAYKDKENGKESKS